MTNVQMILNKEAELKAKFEEQMKSIQLEKEDAGKNIVAQAMSQLEMLGCEYLLDTPKTINNNTITINKGKVVKIEKKVKVEVPVEKIVEKIVYKEADPIYIPMTDTEELDKALAELAAIKKELEAERNTNKELKKQLALKEDNKINELLNAVKEPISEDVTVLPEINKVDTEEEIVLKDTKIYNKSSKVKMYQTDRCFLIASSVNHDITWISKEQLSDEYKAKVEQHMIANNLILPSRVKTSPVKVEKSNGYMARVEAVNNNGLVFDNQDKLSGYVVVDENFYLYTYQVSKGRPFVDDFNKKLNGVYANIDDDIRPRVEAEIHALYEEYVKECEALLNQNDIKRQEELERRKAMREGRAAQKAAFANAKSLKSDNSIEVVNSNTKVNKTQLKSRKLMAAMDEF